jgi:hypothetical protein
VTLRSSLTRTATIAMAIAAFAAPTAFARPADMPPAVAKAATAAQHKQAERTADVGDYPTRPAQGEQANPRPAGTTTAATGALADRDIAWTTIGIGIGVAGSLLALGAIAGNVRHTRRSGRPRVTA